eukprot:507634-Lingulodinium_polyedra.AAC.1
MAQTQTACLPFGGNDTNAVPTLTANGLWPQQMAETTALLQPSGCPAWGSSMVVPWLADGPTKRKRLTTRCILPLRGAGAIVL